jgi:hypothetical protein
MKECCGRPNWEKIVLKLWDLADQCCLPRDVLCLETEGYGVWRWFMGSAWRYRCIEEPY